MNSNRCAAAYDPPLPHLRGVDGLAVNCYLHLISLLESDDCTKTGKAEAVSKPVVHSFACDKTLARGLVTAMPQSSYKDPLLFPFDVLPFLHASPTPP